MKKIKEALRLYAPIFIIIAIGIGWLLVSVKGDFYFITTYLLYIAIIMAGFGIVKYDKHKLADLELRDLEKEIRFLFVFLMFLLLGTVLLWVTHKLELAYCVALLLLVGVGSLDLILKYQEVIRKRKIKNNP